MKLVKSLLLGTAAGLVAMSGAQAADLPVKAKPVEYVKVCSAYGAGFYYIPGTDICLRVGGYTFIEAGWNGRAGDPLIYNYNIGVGVPPAATVALLNRDDNRLNWRARGDVILDARTQTPQGTLRTYIQAGWDYNNNLAGAPPPGTVTPGVDRAFTQWAGFTFGYAETFFSFQSWYTVMAPASVSWNWNPMFAYTANFGNGFSATLSLEDGQAHRAQLLAAGVGPFINVYGGQVVPDIVGNLRVDQAWGSAQLSGVLHQVRMNSAANLVPIGDTWGGAISAGIEVKTPSVAPGDSFVLQGVWARGAIEYTGLSASPLATALSIGTINNAGLGAYTLLWDGLQAAGAPNVTLSTAWSAFGQFRHFWTPALRTAFWAGYNAYNPALSNVALGSAPPLRMWQVGASTWWSPVPTLDLSLDFMWTNLQTNAPVVLCAGCGVVGTIDQFSVWTRWRRNF